MTWHTYAKCRGVDTQYTREMNLWYIVYGINACSVRDCAAFAVILLSDYGRDSLFPTIGSVIHLHHYTLVSCHFTHPHIRTRHSPCIAMDRSTELKLFAEYSLSELRSRLPLRNGPLPRLMRFCDKCSPHKFEPPCVYGMFSRATPCKCGPFAKSNETPSHCSSFSGKKRKKDVKESVKCFSIDQN